MDQKRPFDEKNAEDFELATKRIEAALAQIAADNRQAPTKANLARLADVHRNTIYNRAQISSVDDNPANGWPLTALARIKDSRKASASSALGSQKKPLLPEDEIDVLQQALEKSRRIAASWFDRTIQLKTERDEFARQAKLLALQNDKIREELDSTRSMLRKGIGVIK